MKRILLCVVFFLASFISSPVFSQVSDAEQTFSKIISGVQLHKLSNGLRVIMYRRDIAPVFAGAVVVRVGGTDEPSGKGGISHLLEHMAFKGTPEIGSNDYGKEKVLLEELEVLAAEQNRTGNLSSEQKKKWQELNKELSELWITDHFSREYEKRGATGLNATTDSELTRYFVNLPRSAFEFWCYMESERLLHPIMRQFYQERDVVLEERRMRYDDDPQGKMMEVMLGSVFRVHPYRNPVIGYAFDIRRLTASMLEEFRKQYYVPGNMVISLVGDINPEQDLPLLERYFGRLPVGPMPERPHAVEPPQEGERVVWLEERSSPELAVVYHKVAYPHPDDAPITIMHEILANGRISPLYTELVKRRQIAASVGSSEMPGAAYPNALVFEITPKTPYSAEDGLKVFDSVLRRFKRNGVSEDDLIRAKRAVAVEYLSGLNSNMDMALGFASSEIFYNDWKAAFDWYKQAMQVSKEDVKRVTMKYLNDASRTVVQLETKKSNQKEAVNGARPENLW